MIDRVCKILEIDKLEFYDAYDGDVSKKNKGGFDQIQV